MKEIADLVKTRYKIIEDLKRELLGPGSEVSFPNEENEIITDLPETRYSIGILFPQGEKQNENNDVVETNEPNIDFVDQELCKYELEMGVKLSVDDYTLNEAKSEDKKSETDNETYSLDDEINLASQNLPSSMGLTFFTKSNVSNVKINVKFGTYRKTLVSDCAVPFSKEGFYSVPEEFSNNVFYDEEIKMLKLKTNMSKKDVFNISNKIDTIDFDLKDALLRLSDQLGRNGYKRVNHSKDIMISFDKMGIFELGEIDGTSLKVSAYKKKSLNNMYSLTIMLVNCNKGRYNGLNSIFQPEIKITNSDNPNLVFNQYSISEYSDDNENEENVLELIYRKKKIYATGHGVSTDWGENNGIVSISTTYFPMQIVPQVEFDIDENKMDKNTLSMKRLSDLDGLPKEEKIKLLDRLVMLYKNWIDEIEIESLELDKQFAIVARNQIEECKSALVRMQYGLNLLANNEIVYDAFVLSNRAMFMQRIHLEKQGTDKLPNDICIQDELSKLNYCNEADKHKWRPFQIAFLLMSIRGIVEDCPERDFVDLIWFPTGGGKTEAYLGLTAFTIFYRKLRYPSESDGTSVIMRYTLRLLASQQFTRASTLICACESIRKDCNSTSKYRRYELGKKEITIGLWIGSNHIPNKNNEAKENFDKLIEAKANNIRDHKDKYNKFQVLKCPWCGTKLVKEAKEGKLVGEWGYKFKNNKRFYLSCTQEGCEFEEKLPIQIIDEELYESPPTLLFGTVDKFAMLPWNNDIGNFFAINSSNRTPELIIQDELHLISGPLGTMVGIYETIIDTLCSNKGIKPKVIASTATIRRAREQCMNLFNREVKQFPPQGINSDDTFFAREVISENMPGRLYVGVMPSGKTKAMMEIRVISSILQRTEMLDVDEFVKDKFWTLAVYFGSLRDLAKCSNLVDDDIKDFIKRMAYRYGKGTLMRKLYNADELTSRISTSMLNETLDKLENVSFSTTEKKYPINVLLASNMISVGVDIARLNIMCLVGQPKTTSEYIQASSRIGRKYPGVAITIYDATKSRDRSHYEQFKPYHEAFYKFVEPTGITPFSEPSRDRALHALIVSFMRHLYGLSGDKDAKFLELSSDAIEKVENIILTRYSEIMAKINSEIQDDSEAIKEEIQEFFNFWSELICDKDEDLYYGYKYIMSSLPSGEKRLLKVFGSEAVDRSKETLTSMRSVDSSISGNILIWENK